MSVAPRRRRAPVAARKARDFLRNADTVLGRVIDAHPGFRWRARMDELAPLDAFGTLIFQVVGQQLSVASTRAIVARIEGLFGGRMPTPTELLAGDPQVLRTAGLSGRKGATRRALAERFVDGRLSDAGLAAMDDDEVEVALMEVPGIGQVAADPSRVREQLALTGQFAAGTSCWRAARTSSCWDAYSGSPALRPAVQRNCSSVSSSWTPPTEPRRRIPGGMRRRLDLASSMLTQPRVLFLDEPTTGRDPRSRKEIWDIVRDRRREGTTIRPSPVSAERADRWNPSFWQRRGRVPVQAKPLLGLSRRRVNHARSQLDHRLQVLEGSAGTRRSSSSSRPSASICETMPNTAARSSSRPVSTVSPPCVAATIDGKADRAVGPSRPCMRITYARAPIATR